MGFWPYGTWKNDCCCCCKRSGFGSGESDARIESIQTSDASLTASDTIKDITISPVDLSRSFVLISARVGVGSGDANIQNVAIRAELTSPTNLRLTRGLNLTRIDVHYQVVQFTAASGVTVQRGLKTLATGTSIATVTAVNLSNTYCIVSFSSSDSASWSDDTAFNWRFVSSTQLQFQNRDSTIFADVAYQVICDPNVSVQRFNIPSITFFGPDNVTIASTPGDNIIINSGFQKVTSDTVKPEDYYLMYQTSPTNIRIDYVSRDQCEDFEVQLISDNYVSKFVQSDVDSSVAASLTQNVTISAVDLSKSIVLNFGLPFNYFTKVNSLSQDADQYSTSELSSATSVLITREENKGTSWSRALTIWQFE